MVTVQHALTRPIGYTTSRAVPIMQTDQFKPGQNFPRPGSDQVDLVI